MNKIEEVMNKFKKIPEISPTFCVYPWMEFILGPTAHIKLCCIAERAVENETGEAYMFGKDSLEGILEQLWLKENS